MNRLIVVIWFLFCVVWQGCDNCSDWASVNAARSCSVVRGWLSGMSDDVCCDKIHFDDAACSNQFYSQLLSLSKESNNLCQRHFPFAVRLTQAKIAKNDCWRYDTPVADLLFVPGNKYKLDVIMLGPFKSWEADQLYFCYDAGSNVVVYVCEISKLNDHNYGGGYSALSSPKAGIGVYNIDIRNILDVERGFRGEGVGMDSFWQDVRSGRARLFWECGTFRILSGKHMYNRESFLIWANNASAVGVFPMHLYRCSDSSCVFLVNQDSTRMCVAMNDMAGAAQPNQ